MAGRVDSRGQGRPTAGGRHAIVVAFAGIAAIIIILPIFAMLGLWVWDNALRIQARQAVDYNSFPWQFWAFLAAAVVISMVAAGLLSEGFARAIFNGAFDSLRRGGRRDEAEGD